MRELPILFSTPMVQAILDGRKVQTRRIMNNDPYRPNYLGYLCDGTHIGRWAGTKRNEGTLWAGFYKDSDIFTIDGVEHIDAVYKKCPYGQPGDHLYVRETWCNEWQDPDGWTGNYLYRADGIEVVDVDGGLSKSPWKPSIHMPKAAARIWLEVMDVRVERLQEIKEADAKAEGIEKGRLYYYGEPHAIKGSPKCYNTAKEAFKGLWDSLNAKRGYGWDTNPWVWVISFKRIKP